MPGKSGIDALMTLDEKRRPVVIFVTAHDRYALSALKAHAAEFLLKPFRDDDFYSALHYAKQQALLRKKGKLADQLAEIAPSLSSAESKKEEGLQQFKKDFLARIPVTAKGVTTFISVASIDVIQSADYYANIFSGGKQYLIRQSLSSLERKLDDAQFMRIHRSMIVNLSKVQAFKSLKKGSFEIRLENGKSLKPGRRYIKELKKRLDLLRPR